MKELIRFLRRMMLHWQLRRLDEQAASIQAARQQALLHLMQIRRERKLKEMELQQFASLCRVPDHS